MQSLGKKREGYGRGEYTITDESALLWSNPTRLLLKLRTTLRAPDYQPPMLPAVALEVVQLARDPDVSIEKIKALIKTEPLVAAKVLRAAQTAHYARGAVISSFDDAIMRLGLKTLGDLFLRESMTAKVFRAADFQAPMEQLRKHSMVVAEVAREVCRRVGFPDEYAFMCGLLHDVGMAAAILIVADVARGEEPPAFDLVARAIEEVHQEASAILAKAWKLPDDIQLVLAHHHSFEVDGRVHPLAAAVCLADWVASEAGAPAGAEAREVSALKAAEALQLNESDLERLKAHALKLV